MIVMEDATTASGNQILKHQNIVARAPGKTRQRSAPQNSKSGVRSVKKIARIVVKATMSVVTVRVAITLVVNQI
jgi:hypothetical protein